MKKLWAVFFAVVMILTATPVGASVWVYTFDNVALDTPTPLKNLPPDIGPIGFSTTFTAAPLSNGFEVQQYNGPSQISGHCLLFNPAYFSSSTPPGNLSLAFSTNVFSVSMTIELVSGASGVTVTNERGVSQTFTTNSSDSGIPVIELNFQPTNLFSIMTLNFIPTGSQFTFLALDTITISDQPALHIQTAGTNLVVTWPGADFVLQSSTNAANNFADVTGATSPWTNAIANTKRFFRLRPGN